MNNKTKKILALACLVSISGCSSQVQRAGGFNLMTDAEGLRAWSDSQIGLVTEGKNPKNVKSAYWQNRDQMLGLQLGLKRAGGPTDGE